MQLKTAPKKSSSEVKIPQRLSIVFLDIVCCYLLSENRNIRRKGYNNILSAFKTLDLEVFKDENLILRLDFIKAALSARIKYCLDNKELVIDYIESIMGDSYKDISLRELNNKEIDYVNNTISNMLDNVIFAKYIMAFDSIALQFKEAGPNEKADIVEKWKELISLSRNAIRQNKIDKSDEDMYSLQEGEFEDYVRYTHSDLSNPSNRLSTGMMGFNQMLNGGFESCRCYCIFGLQGEGKSSTLVNLAYQIKMYNRNYKTKDPTKKPCVVYLTMEDHPKETLSRQFSMVTEKGDLVEHPVEESIMLMREAGLVVTPDNPIDIIVKYKPNESVDTSYIYDLVDDLDEMGYECICVILDYLNRIRSVNSYATSEERLRLGAVVNELKTIATELNIPIITAAQFNRGANGTIDDARSNGKEDLVDLLGRTNIAESMKILDNLDGAFYIVPEFDYAGNKYLGIKLVKNRWRADFTTPLVTAKKVIHHPYTNNFSMRLAEDVGTGSPVHRLTLVDIQDPNGPNVTIDPMIIPDEDWDDGEDDDNFELNTIKENAKAKVLEENGIKNNSKVKVVGGVAMPNLDNMTDEEKKKYKKDVVPQYNITPERYSVMYTLLCDPYTTVRERYVNDYNREFNTNFSVDEYAYLAHNRHLMKMSEKPGSVYEDEEVDPTRINPFVKIVDKPVNPFVKISARERDMILRSGS